MEITLGDIVFGGSSAGDAGGGGGSVSSSHPLPNGIKFVGSTWETFDCGKYDWSQIYDASEMFKDCANLKRIDNFPKNEINGCIYMFDGCSSLESIPNGINLKPYYTIENMFAGCTNLTEIPYFDTSKVYSFYYTWYNCKALTEFPMLDTSKVTDFQGAWSDCSSLTEFPSLDMSSGTDFMYAWEGCTKLTSLPQLDLSNGVNFGSSFYSAWEGCYNLVNLGGFGAIKADIDLSACSKLTVDSLMNVITQAATVTGKTMRFGSDNLAKLSDEQKAVATSKGWTLA